MSDSPVRPRALQWQVFRARDAIDSGLVTIAGLRTGAYRRLLRGVYADSRLNPDHLLRCHAASLVVPATAAIAGTSAAVLHGVEQAADARTPVHVLVGREHRFGPVQGLRVHTTVSPLTEGTDVIERNGVRCTSGMRTAQDVARWCRPVEAVPVLDAMVRTGVVTASDVSALAATVVVTRVTGARRAAYALGLADGRAGSPAESRLRVRLVEDGLPPPVPQYPVRVRSGFVCHPDLAWPEYRVAVEYDGAYHAEPEQLDRDRERLNALVDAGWVVLHATARRVRDDLPGLLREVREALQRRGASL